MQADDQEEVFGFTFKWWRPLDRHFQFGDLNFVFLRQAIDCTIFFPSSMGGRKKNCLIPPSTLTALLLSAAREQSGVAGGTNCLLKVVAHKSKCLLFDRNVAGSAGTGQSSIHVWPALE